MKRKILTVLVLVVLVFTLGACGNKETEGTNSFAEYANKGYTHGGIGYESDDTTDTILSGYYSSEDKTDFVLITAKITEDEIKAYDNVDILSETYEEDLEIFLASIPESEITITSLNDKVPSQEEIDKYVGKTLSDIETDGYDWAYDDEYDGEEVRVYQNYDTGYCLGISIEGGLPDLFVLSGEEIEALKITKVKFWGFEGN